MSADRRAGVTVIALVGNVFSPYYFAARRRGPAEPMDFCALNVAVHGPGGSAFVYTEWPPGEVHRTADHLGIGRSFLEWRGDHLAAHFDDVTVPGYRPVHGRLWLYPHARFDRPFVLDEAGRHRWWAIAPSARIEVEFDQPALRFSGTGYHDGNEGDEPIEAGFRFWTWSRLVLPNGTAVLYDADRRRAGPFTLAALFGHDGTVTEIAPPPPANLGRTGLWLFPRPTRCEPGGAAEVLATQLDSPFYARTLMQTRLGGRVAVGVHEALSLDVFRTPWMQFMLRYRTLRYAR